MKRGKEEDFDRLFPMSTADPVDSEEGDRKESKPRLRISKPSKHLNLFQKEKMRQRESLDYRLADNEPLREYYKTHMIDKKLKPKLVAAKWFIYLMIGLMLGVITFLIKWGVDELVKVKGLAVNYFMDRGNYLPAFFMHYLINTGYALIACAVVLLCGVSNDDRFNSSKSVYTNLSITFFSILYFRLKISLFQSHLLEVVVFLKSKVISMV